MQSEKHTEYLTGFTPIYMSGVMKWRLIGATPARYK